MKFISARVLAVAAIAAALTPALQAAEVKAAFATDKPPFSFKDASGANVGIEVDVIRTALDRMGNTTKAQIVPNVRLPAAIKAGEVDIAAAVQGKDGDGAFFSDTFVEYVNVAISKKSKNIDVKTPADLDKYSFVIWQEGWRDLGPQFEATYKPDAGGKFRPNYKQANNQAAQSEMFWGDRVDLIVVDKTIFEYYRKQLAATFKTSDEVVYHDVFKSRTGFPAMFKDAALRDKFNKTLSTMRSDGSYEAILKKYK